MLERKKEEKETKQWERVERKCHYIVVCSVYTDIFKPIITMGQSGFGQAEFRKHLKKKTSGLNSWAFKENG